MAAQPTDRDLLLAWQGGDRSRGSELFSRHAASIMRFFRNKVAGAAEELTQQTFLALVESIDRYRAESSFRGYLFGVARNQLLMHLRRRSTDRESFDPSTWSVVDAGAAPDRIAARHQEHTLLLAALQRIPVDMQIVFELHYWEGLTVSYASDSAPPLSVVQEVIVARAGDPGQIRSTRWALSRDGDMIAAIEDPSGVENEPLPDGLVVASERGSFLVRVDSVWDATIDRDWERLVYGKAYLVTATSAEGITAREWSQGERRRRRTSGGVRGSKRES